MGPSWSDLSIWSAAIYCRFFALSKIASESGNKWPHSKLKCSGKPLRGLLNFSIVLN